MDVTGGSLRPVVSPRKCLRFTFLAAFLCLNFLAFRFSRALAEDEMQEEFRVKVRGGQITEYVKNELGMKPKRNDDQPCEEQEHDWHYRWTRTCLSLLYVLTVPKSLVDSVQTLHCLGDFPGEGAFKLAGARVQFLTFMSKEHFKIVDQRGFECIVPVMLLIKVVVFMIQFAIWCLTWDHKLWIQMGVKSVAVSYLCYKWLMICKSQKASFKTATAGWLTFLRDQLGAKVTEGNVQRPIQETDLEALSIPSEIPSWSPNNSETVEEFRERIQQTLKGHVIHSLTMLQEDQEGQTEKVPEFPAYLNKLWLHIFKKHFRHCLGKKLSYEECWPSVHRPIPKFHPKVRKGLLRFTALAFVVILGACIFVDLANQQVAGAAGAKHFLAPKKLLN